MGALHAGHASLIKKSCAQNSKTLVSIFVNPTQFSAGEDFEKYPRPERQDFRLLRSLRVDAVYSPRSALDLYSQEPGMKISLPPSLENRLCGAFRPGHFQGVATIVLKLLILAKADRAYFGEKDYQQLQVVKHLVSDFFLDTKIVGVPTVRESSGLAMSSRNAYLTGPYREAAAYLFHVLKTASKPSKAIELLESAGFQVDYLEIWNDDLTAPLKGPKGRWLCAAHFQGVRLIDNLKRSIY